MVDIRTFAEADRASVIGLWQAAGLLRPWNDPDRDIDRKVAHDPEGFMVGVTGDRVVAVVMAGYDGHRGWVNYLAVHPDVAGSGIGRTMMQVVEQYLIEQGCPKISIQVRGSNEAAIAFYEHIGFSRDNVASLGKRLIPDL